MQLLVTRGEQLFLALFGADGLASTNAAQREASTRGVRALVGGARRFKRIFGPIYERAQLALRGKSEGGSRTGRGRLSLGCHLLYYSEVYWKIYCCRQV